MERDEETGLSYHGARYCAPWLGKWVSTDPASSSAGINLYEYGASNPVLHVDLSGYAPMRYEKQRAKDTRHKANEMKANLMKAKAVAKKMGEKFTRDPMQTRAAALAKKRGKTPIEQHHHTGVKEASEVKLPLKEMGEHMSSLWSTKSDPAVTADIGGKAATHHNVGKHLDLDEQAKAKTELGRRTAKSLKDSGKASEQRVPDTVDMTERAGKNWTRGSGDPTARKVKPYDPNKSSLTPKAEQQMRARNAQMAKETKSANLRGFEEFSGAQSGLRSRRSSAAALL